MADPLTLAASIVTLLGAIATVSQSCHNIWERYQSAHHHLMSLDVECSALSTSLQAIRQVIIAKHSDFQTMIKSNDDESLFEDLRTTLSSCSIVIGHLNEQVAKLYHATDSKKWYTFSGRAKYVWNEDAIRSLLDRTRGLTGAVNLILNTLQTQSLVNVWQAMQQRQKVVETVRQSAKALQLEDDATSTIFLPNTEDEPGQTAEQASHIDELMKSPAYKRAFLKWLEQPDEKDDDDGVADSDTNLMLSSSNDSLSDSSIISSLQDTDPSPAVTSSAGLTSATAALSLQETQTSEVPSYQTVEGRTTHTAASDAQTRDAHNLASPLPAVPSSPPQETGPRAAANETGPHAQISQVLRDAAATAPWETESATLVEPESDEEQPPAYTEEPVAPVPQPRAPPVPRAAPPPIPQTVQAPVPSREEYIEQTVPRQRPVEVSAPDPDIVDPQAPDPDIVVPESEPGQTKSKSWWSFGKSKSSGPDEKATEKQKQAEQKQASAAEDKQARIAKLQVRRTEAREDLDILREAQGLIRDRVAATSNARAIRACKRRIRAYEKELKSLGVEGFEETTKTSETEDGAEVADSAEGPGAEQGGRLARSITQRSNAALDTASVSSSSSRPSNSRKKSLAKLDQVLALGANVGADEAPLARQTSRHADKRRARREARREHVRKVLG